MLHLKLEVFTGLLDLVTVTWYWGQLDQKKIFYLSGSGRVLLCWQCLQYLSGSEENLQSAPIRTFLLHEWVCKRWGSGGKTCIAFLSDCRCSLKSSSVILLLALTVSVDVGVFELRFGFGLLIHRYLLWLSLDWVCFQNFYLDEFGLVTA